MTGKSLHFFKRVSAMLICVIMLLSMVPVPAFAEGESGDKISFSVKDWQNAEITDAVINVIAPEGCVVTGYEVAVPEGTAEITYSVAKTGYKTVEATAGIPADGIIAVTLIKECVVSAVKTGEGSITLNGAAGAVSVDAGSEVTAAIIPAEGWYVSSCTGISDCPENGYTGKLTVVEDTTISVTFAKYLTVTTTVAVGGTVRLGESADKDTVQVKNGDKVKVTVTPDKSFWISSVTGHADLSDCAPNTKTAYEKEIVVVEDTSISAVFTEYFTVTATCGENGTITAPNGGTMSMEKTDANGVAVKATPNTGYRVASVTVNGHTEAFTENDRDFAASYRETTTVEVIFAPNTYVITIQDTTDGSVTADHDTVDYGGGAVVTVTPKDGYDVDTVAVNGISTAWTWSRDNAATVTLSGVAEDQTITVAFKEIDKIDEPGDITSAESTYAYLNLDGSLVAGKNVYAKGSPLALAARDGYTFVRINGGKGMAPVGSLAISETTTISTVDLLNADGWHRITLAKPIEIVVDKTAATAVITPAALPEGITHYNSDPKLAISVSDSESGIKVISYRVICDGEETRAEELYTYDSGAIQLSFEKDIIVDAAKNNSDDVKVVLTVIDRAGNESVVEQALKINTEVPQISVSFDNTAVINGRYFAEKRTATMTIIERDSTFNAERATAAIALLRCTKDTEEPAVVTAGERVSMIGEWITDPEDSTKHTAEVEFNGDGSYKWSVDYTNLANSSAVRAEEAFVIDTKAPMGELAFEGTFWSNILSALTFGLWKDGAVTVTVPEDKIVDNSGVSVAYYNSEGAVVSEEGLKALPEESWNDTPIEVKDDCRFVAYARLTDMAGHVTYIGSEGIVVDKADPEITITPVTAANENGYYNSDFEVKVNVVDPGVYSGLASVTYEIVADSTAATPNVTQSGTIYSGAAQSGAALTDLLSEVEQNIEINVGLNNSDHVKLTVTAIDNAGNTVSSSYTFAVNSTTSTVSVKFEKDMAVYVDTDNNGRGYFNTARTAEVTVTDRGSTFDGDAAAAAIRSTITAKNAAGADVEDAYTVSRWEDNGDQHTVTVRFSKDANYTWDISEIAYTNKAGKTTGAADCTAEGVTPVAFTVDTISPFSGEVKAKEVGEGTTSWEQTWNELLNKITFGIFKRVNLRYEAKGEDATSPLTYAYYVTNEINQLSEAALDDAEFVAEEPEVSPESRVVVYAKISDYAGNYIYRQSDGAILDTKKPIVTLTPAEANENGVYDGDVTVNVEVTDPGIYSGIKSVSYRVEKDGQPTQEGSLYSFEKTEASYNELVPALNSADANSELKQITVKAVDNNSSDVKIFVTAVDNADNSSDSKESCISLDIDITSPTIEVSFGENEPVNGKYFRAARTATVTITERSNHFDAEAATAALRVGITAKNAAGAAVEDAYTINASSDGSIWTTTKGATPDEDTHTATITFGEDANYSFKPAYTDKAGNPNKLVTYSAGSAAVEEFTVDTTAPTGSVKAIASGGEMPDGSKEPEHESASWSDLKGALTFGFWSAHEINITGTAADATAPVQDVSYYKVTGDAAKKALNETDLAGLSAESWKKLSVAASYDVLTIEPDEQAVVYLRITDMANHVTYISTDGLIADKTAPHEEYTAPEIYIKTDGTTDKIYNGDVTVTVEVNDPIVNGTYSGIKSVDYTVTSYAVDGKTVLKTTTGEGCNLYSFAATEPSTDDLRQELKGLSFIVKSREHNSNKVVIKVTAVDNAGNSTTVERAVMIDVSAPGVTVTYDNNSVDSEKYFKADRTMTIAVQERNFDKDKFEASITGFAKAPELKWSKAEPAPTGNGNDTTYTTTVKFDRDSDYTVAMSCTDMAGNRTVDKEADKSDGAEGVVSYADQAAPQAFTIDKTAPIVRVSYDNNSARNGNYYKEHRTATIAVTEHNFNSARVSISGTANNDGTVLSFPTLSAWGGSGDTHTATLSYTADAFYTFDITVSDLAGNMASDYPEDKFFVDTTKPVVEITGVANQSANNGTVAPVITFSDTNFDENGTTITLRGSNNGEVNYARSFAEITHGRVFTYADFKHAQEVDDLYELSAVITDMAGNEARTGIAFSANRFGSVYTFEDTTKAILGKYIQQEQDIVFIETNVDSLERDTIKVRLTQNGIPGDLKENADFTVSATGGNGSWSRYRYTVDKRLLENEGVYSLAVYSVDRAGNVNENIDETKKAEISFGVDKTAPVIVPVDFESNTQYAVNSKSVDVEIKDNLALKNVEILLNGERTDYTVNGETYSFTVGQSNHKQNAEIIATDEAGNAFTVEVNDFLVSTNILARWYNNTPLFFGSLGGAAAVGIGVALLLRRKKEKVIA